MLIKYFVMFHFLLSVKIPIMFQNSSDTQDIIDGSDPCGSDDQSSSEDEAEPILKYERLRRDIRTTVQKEAVSCLAFNSKIICIGTFWGLIHVFNHQGNRISTGHLKAHTLPINQICLDWSGDFIASCSHDGKAYICGLYSAKNQLQFSTDQPIYCVAIDPDYSKLGPSRRFITGSDRLLLHEKSSFGWKLRTSALLESIGPVQSLKWQGRFVTYTYHDNVRIYDVKERKLVGLILWDQPEDNEVPEQYPCSFSWKNSSTLLIGWRRTIRICRIEKRRRSSIRKSPTFMVNVAITMRVGYYICGISPLDVSQLVILAYQRHPNTDRDVLPHLYFLQAIGSQYVEVHSAALSLRSYHQYTCEDFHWEHLQDGSKMIIASPRDVVVAMPFDDDDRIDWFVDRNRFDEAMTVATVKQECLQRNTLLEVGRKYINYLLSQQEYTLAGQICTRVLGDDKNLWQNEASKFARAGQLRALDLASPVQKMDARTCKMMLQEYLKRKPEKFVDIVPISPEEDKPVVWELVASSLNVGKMPAAVDIGHCTSKPFEEELDFYIAVQYKGVFEYIQENGLKSKLYGRLDGLMEVDALQTVNLLVEGDALAVEKVVLELQANEYHLYLYLDALNTNSKYAARQYHNQLVGLYAKFRPAKLLPLLRRSRHYRMAEALSICEAGNLHREVVYLLSRMGNTKRALQVSDVDQMIDYFIFFIDQDRSDRSIF